MSEQQFVLDKLYYTIMTPIEKISVGRSYMTYGEVVDYLNEQQDTITNLEEYCGDLEADVKRLMKKNERLKNKLNVTALELVDEAISMGKAVEISEMSYREFLDYRSKNGKPMELQI